MKKTGVWLDKNKALIVTMDGEKVTLNKIASNVEHFNIRGGSGTRFKGGPQDVVQDGKFLEREKNQLKQYYKSLALEINDTDALVIFGPAETNEKFSEELQKNYQSLSTKIKGVKKADSMTDNQVKAWVKDFFE